MLRVEGVRVLLGEQRHVAVDDATLAVGDGEVLAVLGPSGCGKSTLLRAIAGLEPVAAGTIAWDDADLAGVPTHRRGFALMFQDGQLFDHLSVAANVGYAPRLRGAARRRVRGEVDDLLELVGLAGYGERLPRTLSGGERQRVALARSLAARPRLLLLDEPLSALDADLRVRLADDLRRILRDAGTAAVLVTHDHDEAFAVADRLAVMRGGRLVQQGAVAQVWAAPADAETARFLGYPVVLEGQAARRALTAAGASAPVDAGGGGDGGDGGGGGGAVQVALRAGAARISPGGALTGRVVALRARADGLRVDVDVEGLGVLPALAGGGGGGGADGGSFLPPDVGDAVRVDLVADRIAVLPG
ncbi:ABC transporter ATP-binding protein [Nocardioides sp.]|uniref:ABC transporter ATP-binding protein n=1 Tax=Nocardioides sp. TaxID=35761 RepID=UPI0035197584